MSLKNKIKRIALPLLAALILSSCAGEAGLISYTSAPESSKEEVSAIDKTVISPAIILPSDSGSGSCMSSAHYNALVAAASELGINDPVVITSASPDTALEGIENANVIFAVGIDYMNTLDAAAKENPSKLYACFGGYKHNTTNYTNFYSAIYEAQYLAGITAAANSTSGKIGIVSEYAAEYPDSAAELNSFALGARSVNPSAEILVRSLSSRTDTTKAQDYTHELIDLGCDVISIQCDTSAPALVAKTREVFFIGYGSDISIFDPDHCLTSVAWDFTSYYKSALNAAINGSWTTWYTSSNGTASGNYYGSLSDGSVYLTPIGSAASPQTAVMVDSVKSLMTTNSFEIFSNRGVSFRANGEAALTTRPLIDNKGRTMISEDGQFYNIYSGDNIISVDPDTVNSDIMASAIMNYLVEGITVIE